MSLGLYGCGDASIEVMCPEGVDCVAVWEYLDGGLVGDAGHGGVVSTEDYDGDGVPDDSDNCPFAYNPNQKDSDHDGIGDACDDPSGAQDGGEIPWPVTDAGHQDIGYDAGHQDPVPDAGNIVPIYDAGHTDPDSDGDGTPDSMDGCPSDPAKTNPGVCGCGASDRDSDSDGTPDCKDSCPSDPAKTSPGVCGCGRQDVDSDGDGIMDCQDNCPSMANKDQADYDDDGQGDACTVQDGTLQHPFIISTNGDHQVFTESRNTANSPSSVFNTYPPNTTNESGKEYIYVFKISKTTYFGAEIKAPEPSGADIDVQLFTNPSTTSPGLVERSDKVIRQKLNKGIYYLSLDSYSGKNGSYTLDVSFRPADSTETFNAYVLKAVDWTEKNYARRGYASAALTHALPYGSDTISPTNAPYTMCVAAAMEIMLTAMRIYAEETGDTSVWNFLPASSWKTLNTSNIRAHIWCNYDIGAGGSGDSLRHFGMGQTVPFADLKPGSFINLNRTSGTGHAVVFLSFIDIKGNDVATYGSNVAGFRYYSSQGSKTNGGFDYRCAFFNQYGTPTLSNGCKRDTGVYDQNASNPGQHLLNTGVMYMPSRWLRTSWSATKSKVADGDLSGLFGPDDIVEAMDMNLAMGQGGEYVIPTAEEPVTVLDESWLDGKTLDDDLPSTYVPPVDGEYVRAIRKGLVRPTRADAAILDREFGVDAHLEPEPIVSSAMDMETEEE